MYGVRRLKKKEKKRKRLWPEERKAKVKGVTLMDCVCQHVDLCVAATVN